MHLNKLLALAFAAIAVLSLGAGQSQAAPIPVLKATSQAQTLNAGGFLTRQGKALAKITGGAANKPVTVAWTIEVITKNAQGVETVWQTINGSANGMTDANGTCEFDFGWQNVNAQNAGKVVPVPWDIKVTETGMYDAKVLNPDTDTSQITQ